MLSTPELPHSSSSDFRSPAPAGERPPSLALTERADDDESARDPHAACRIAEAEFRSGNCETAAERCRRALPALGDDVVGLRICAWVLSNNGSHREAGVAYQRLIELQPEWIDGHRHLSGVLAAGGEAQAAIRHARLASDRAPCNAEFALHAASLLLAADQSDMAADYLDRAAISVTGEDEVTVLGELLMRCGRIDEAAALLRDAAKGFAAPRLLRALSAAEMLRGHLEAALACVEAAISDAPEVAEYHTHRGHLLWNLGDLEGAAEALDRAADLDPQDRLARRARMALLAAAGRIEQAVAVAGELLSRFPLDDATAEAVLEVLRQRVAAIDGEWAGLADGVERVPRPARPTPRIADRLRSQVRVIGALIIRETRTRFADFKLGYGWALLEPILHIALLSATFAVLMHGQPPIGTHFFLFYYTGLIPYQVFTHTSSGMAHAITGNAALLQLPPVTSFDVIAARGALEVATDLVVAVVLLAGFAALSLPAMPDDMWSSSMALLVTAALGCGIGYVNAVVSVFWRSWERVYGQLVRILYFVSGIFYVPAMMPDWVRDVLAWNPLLQAIDWFRAGFFGSYQPHWLDRPYLAVVTILSLLGGLVLHRGLRRRLSMPL